MTFQLQFRRYALPFRVPVRTAHGPWPVREGLLVRLEDEAGVVGFGEAAPIPGFGGAPASALADACAAFGGRVAIGQIAALPGALACLRHALEAAAARESFVPRQPTLAVAALLPAGAAAPRLAAAFADSGFRVFKWKVGTGAADAERGLLDELCAALPAGATVRLDANGAWDRREAERWLAHCADRPVEFVEQPVPRGADDLLLGLASDHPTPLALDESLAVEGDLDHWLGLGWRGIFVVKPSLLGNVGAALGRLAAAGAPVVFSSALETAVGARSALRAAFGWPGPARALGFGVWPLFADARCDGPSGAPFLRWEDVARIQPEDTWTALA